MRVCGIGEPMKELAREYATLKSHSYTLRFRYPTKEDLMAMRTVHRDIRDDEATLIDSHKTNLRRLMDDIEKKHVHVEDMAEFRPALRHLLAVREGGWQHDDG